MTETVCCVPCSMCHLEDELDSSLEAHMRTLIELYGPELLARYPFGMKLIYEDLGIPLPGGVESE